MDQERQPSHEDEGKLLEPPQEEKRIEPPEAEQLLPAHTPSNKNGGMMKVLLITMGILLILALSFAAYMYVVIPTNATPSSISENISEPYLPPNIETDTPTEGNIESVCTMDAKVCPDGSSVGRQGPNCEFAACPGE